jgi:hypothetical protein
MGLPVFRKLLLVELDEQAELGNRDNHQRLCFSLALWNGKDGILKERLYGLNGNQGELLGKGISRLF